MTLAPSSASDMVANGPAMKAAHSVICNPERIDKAAPLF
jgi:hypothetical protein